MWLSKTDRYNRFQDESISSEQLLIEYSDKTKRIQVTNVVADAQRDLAILALTSPSDPQPPAFLYKITRKLSTYLEEIPLEAWGYPGSEGGETLLRHPVTAKMRSYRAKSDLLSDLQLEGGLPAGCSGGPVLIEFKNQFLCIGINRLGGEKAPTSRLIAADTVVAFLHEQGIDVSLLEAWKVLSNKERIKTLWMSLVVSLLAVILSFSVAGQKA